MNPKTKRTIALTVTIISVLIIASGAIIQVFGIGSVDRDMTKVGAGEYYRIIGIIKILLVVLYLLPKTLRLGFLLLSCIFAGAMATLLTHAESFIPAAIPLTVLWIATFLRDRSIFIGNTKSEKPVELTNAHQTVIS